jgi:deoxyribose-phosphate aldolase
MSREVSITELITQVRQQLDAISDLPTAPQLERPGVDAATVPLAATIDHTLLRPEATAAQIATLCSEALQFGFASVCVNPTFVRLCAQQLAGSSVAVCTVIGFPLGATSTSTKVAEAAQAIADGAQELDMVVAIGYLKAGDWHTVAHDIAAVVQVAHAAHVLVKVIIETALLSEAEKVAACLIAARAGADFVKTSTGFLGGGATVADIALMRQVVGPALGVKASGGVRRLTDAHAMLSAGATRIGSSAGVAIMHEQAHIEPDPSTPTPGY